MAQGSRKAGGGLARPVTPSADLAQICGSGCTLDPSVFDSQPPSTVVARFHLRTGRLF